MSFGRFFRLDLCLARTNPQHPRFFSSRSVRADVLTSILPPNLPSGTPFSPVARPKRSYSTEQARFVTPYKSSGSGLLIRFIFSAFLPVPQLGRLHRGRTKKNFGLGQFRFVPDYEVVSFPFFLSI